MNENFSAQIFLPRDFGIEKLPKKVGTFSISNEPMRERDPGENE